jgi:hypothetical protein
MNQEEYKTKKEKLFEYFQNAGIDVEEAEKFFKKEFEVSVSIGMSEHDSNVRSLISTMNYYRKYIDKLGNRVKFLCLGASQPTDFGLNKKIKEIRTKFISASTPDYEKDEMIENKVVDKRGVPLHTADTSIFEEKHGHPINIDEEMSQTLIGIIEDTTNNTKYPALIRIYGKEACDKHKEMFVWSWITGEQGKSDKYPGYIVINTRDPLISVQKGQTRISFEDYEKYITEFFKSITYDVENGVDNLDDIKTHVFLRNGMFLSMDKNTFGWETSLIKRKDRYEAKADISADVRLPQNATIDFDETLPDTVMYICALPRYKKQNGRLILEAIGVFVNNPIDRGKYEMKSDFMLSDEDEVKNLVNAQKTGYGSTENHDFIRSLNGNNDSHFG